MARFHAWIVRAALSPQQLGDLLHGFAVISIESLVLQARQIEDDSFLIGAMNWSMTFRVTRPPHPEDKIWRMTLDGVTYSHS